MWVRDDVAALHALTRDPCLSGATLRQNGGMCVAVHVPLTDDTIPGEDLAFVVVDEENPIDIHASATRYRFIAEPCPCEDVGECAHGEYLEACLSIEGVVKLAKTHFRHELKPLPSDLLASSPRPTAFAVDTVLNGER